MGQVARDFDLTETAAHRLRHTVGAQLAEGGAQIQTITAILEHRSATMSATFSHISDPVLREQYEKVIAAGAAWLAGRRGAVGQPDRPGSPRLAEDRLLHLQARLATERMLRLAASLGCGIPVSLGGPVTATSACWSLRSVTPSAGASSSPYLQRGPRSALGRTRLGGWDAVLDDLAAGTALPDDADVAVLVDAAGAGADELVYPTGDQAVAASWVG